MPEAIAVENLTKRFGDFTAVDAISFAVGQGEIFGFLGANGGGKSTTIRMLCGILSPTAGRGQVAGCDLTGEPEKIKRAIGYMSQKFSLYEDLTPLENIRFYLGIYAVDERLWPERSARVLELARLNEFRNRPTMELPQGWRQRLALGCALLHEPRIVFLDEPTSGVDPLTRRHFWMLIHELAATGITVFVTTHYMDEALNCDRLALINQGRLVGQGAPAEIIRAACPDAPEATLNDAFLKLMARGAA
ncbi:MAG: putative ABC transporter ATP-binding protein YbhF [Deltaproteobacteria bacterium ADurb.Bin510]|nr:MAG: putative ABC transporter ATP-binding protein YbhF [Deltaproteobacteria bacterium ADurb.Bin510]